MTGRRTCARRRAPRGARSLADKADHDVASVVHEKRSRFDICRISFRKTGVHFSGKCSNGIAGFTLLEMIVAVAILAVVAALAMPYFARPSDGVRLQAAVRELAGALRLTRTTAIARDTDMALEIDVERRTFQSPAVPQRSFAPDIFARLTVAEPERSTASRGGFRFFPDGSSTGGDVVLVLRDQTARLCVDWLTGALRHGKHC